MDFLGTVVTCVCACVCWCAQARVMATIGVTRGLGDHDLKVYNSNIYIKPFLSCVPEVSVRSESNGDQGFPALQTEKMTGDFSVTGLQF